MAKTANLSASISLSYKITLELTPIEAEALNEMTKYGIDSFIKGYRKMLGTHYIKPHEEGLGILFKNIDQSLPHELYKLKKYREATDEIAKKLKELENE